MEFLVGALAGVTVLLVRRRRRRMGSTGAFAIRGPAPTRAINGGDQ